MIGYVQSVKVLATAVSACN